LLYRDISEIPEKYFSNIPVIIPTYNQLWYCKNTIKQLKRFGLNNFIILDNGSTYSPFLKWVNNCEHPCVINYNNPGPREFFFNMNIWDRLPDIFIVTDPDLDYPKEIPDTMVNDLINIATENGWPKIALGLTTDPVEDMYEPVKNWEADYWKNIILYTDGNDPIYEAKTDTTFSIYNKKFVRRVGYMGWDGEFFIAPRVCGRYTCKHWGWYYKKPIPENEDKFGKEKVGLWSSTQNELIKRGIDA